jgi:hypothetical protein
MKMRRVAAALVLIVVSGAVATHVAHSATAARSAPAGSLLADFNNDGADDLAVGVPFEFVGAIQDAGR